MIPQNEPRELPNAAFNLSSQKNKLNVEWHPFGDAGFTARQASGKTDHYFVLLGADYYDAYPPTVMFVRPGDIGDWLEAKQGTVWYPTVKFPPQPAPWFQLHPAYQIEGYSQPRQLVCFSFTAEYYMTNHSPTETQKWVQGRHTVAATLNRLQEVLLPPLYQVPSGS